MMSRIKEAKSFCAVCRYVLVETIDPSQHSFIDHYYDVIYPQE
jgi:hypothetical protein